MAGNHSRRFGDCVRRLPFIKMIFSVEVNNQIFRIDLANPIDISIPLNFNGAQPNAYGVEKATSKPCEAGSLIGDTRRGGSCNFEAYKFIPHCNGTHTESIGHITNQRISVRDCLQDAFVSAVLLTVEPEKADETEEAYTVNLDGADRLITRNALANALKKIEQPNIPNPESFIVRTLPNNADKLTMTYLEIVPPFFSLEAMQFINERGVKHLLVDTPSIDKIYDEGKLSNHRIFWNVRQGEFETNEMSLIHRTITELIYAPNDVADGLYFLNLQIAPFAADASPSRPLLFRIAAA